MSEYPTQADEYPSAEYSTSDFATAEIDNADYGYDAPDVDLDSDPFADDLSKDLAAAASKTWFNRATVVVGALALIVGGFLGGVQVQKHYGKSATSTSAANALAALRNGGGLNRGGAGGGTGGGFTGGFGGGTGTGTGTGTANRAAAGQTGTVKLVDGSTIYVTLSDGTVLTVTTSGTTKVSTSKAAKIDSVKAGDTVTITGSTPDANGNMTATSVTDTK